MMAPVLLVRIVDPQGRLAGWQHGLLGLFMFVGLMLAGLAVEGWGVCMVIVAPIFLWLSPICAILAGELLRERHQKGRLPVTVLPAVPFLLLPLDKQFLPPPEAVEVATSALVAAPPQEVWTALAEARNIRREEQRFTLAQSILSIPRPVDARLDRAGIGGVRHVRWERGVHFDEVVTDWQPGKRLAWRFAFQPDSFGQTIDGHIFPDSAYLKVSNGEYRLVAVPGGTRVTLITRYRLATRLNGWCRLWGEVLIGDFHRNVLHVMAGRASSEQSAKTARLVGFADGQS
ncbi:MAG: SRPBCC family protein [Sphingomonadales bacterium]